MIDVDDAASWPVSIGDLLHDAHPALPKGPDGRPRCAARGLLVAEVDRRLAGCSVLAWHCTRLCPDEIAVVEAEGMFLSSRASMVERVTRRMATGDLTLPEAGRLLGARRARDDARCGQIWFSLTRHSAASWGRSGMWDLWGGEALYFAKLEGDDALSLNHFGSPCVVKLAVPVELIVGSAVAECLVRSFECSRGIERAEFVAGATFVNVPIGPERVLRVLRCDDPDFSALMAPLTCATTSVGLGDGRTRSYAVRGFS